MYKRIQQSLLEKLKILKRPMWKRLLWYFVIIVIFFGALTYTLLTLAKAPKDFPSGKLVEIPAGMSVMKAGKMLESMHIVKSAVMFQTLVILYSSDKGVRSGFYIFDSPQSVLTVADKLSFGRYGISRSKITLPEGDNSTEMTAILSTALPRLNKDSFLKLAQANEGYMFPETYYFFETASAQEIIDMLTNEFEIKLEPHLEDIAASGHTEKEIITMASIIEKESNGTSEDQAMISGILWNRIKKGMPLQVDATYVYTHDDSIDGVPTRDVKKDPSPYNTYVNKGLPPGPIGNPGLKAILAALNPTKSNYLFYIHDRDGNPHYSKTYSQHLANINMYLK